MRLVSSRLSSRRRSSLVPGDKAGESPPVTVVHTLRQTLKAVGLGLRAAQTVGRPSEIAGAAHPVMNDGVQRSQSDG